MTWYWWFLAVLGAEIYFGTNVALVLDNLGLSDSSCCRFTKSEAILCLFLGLPLFVWVKLHDQVNPG